MALELEEKRRVEDALRPVSMDLDTPKGDGGGVLTKNNSSAITPVIEGGEDDAEEEENKE